MVSDNDFAYLSYLENELVCKSPKKMLKKAKKYIIIKKQGSDRFPKITTLNNTKRSHSMYYCFPLDRQDHAREIS